MAFFVAGATGNVGSELVRQLAAAGEPVRALTRRPEAAELPDGAVAVGGDLDHPDTLAPALDGARGAFLLSGYADMAGLLAAVRDAGIERVVLLSASAADTGDLDNAVARYHLQSEQAVKESGVPFTILRPRTFMSNTLRWRDQLAAGDVVREPFADVAVATVDPADIAAVAARAFLGEGHAGRTYRVTGPRALRPDERLAILGVALGRELRLEPLSNDEARAELSATMPAEYVDAFFRFFVDGTLDEATLHSTVRDVTGRDPATFEQWVETHADAFR